MATLRTDEEKSAIVAQCLRLEEEGGDILGFLWKQNYYTPRATWCNIQREWLGRKPYEFTDGKPKERKGKTVKAKVMTDEQKRQVIEAAIAGKDPRVMLEELGYKSPDQKWFELKKEMKAKDPGLCANLPAKLSYNGVKNKAVKVDNGMPKAETPEKLQLQAGANYQVSVAETPEAQKITAPVSYDGFKVRAVSGIYGRCSYSETRSAYIDYENNDGDELSMTLEQWRGFLDELRMAALVLGVEL